MEEKPKYKKGDLIILNDFGTLVIDVEVYVGIVVADPYYKWWPPAADEHVALQYWAYNVQFGDQFMELVPQEFLDRMVLKEDEEKK